MYGIFKIKRCIDPIRKIKESCCVLMSELGTFSDPDKAIAFRNSYFKACDSHDYIVMQYWKERRTKNDR